VKFLRLLLVALTLSLAATGALTLSARATPSASQCGLWDYCFCQDIGCYMGDQLCASTDRWQCYQF